MNGLVVIAMLISAAFAVKTNHQRCSNCEFNLAGLGYLPNTSNCFFYIQCQKLADGSYISHDMTCAPGTYWRQEVLTCDTEWDGLYPCGPTGTTAATTSWVCYLEKYDSDPTKYYSVSNGYKILMPCPSGTTFNEIDCGCTNKGPIIPCSKDPLLRFPFTTHFNDIQCPKTIGTPFGNPRLTNGALCVDGNDKIEFGHLNNWFAENPTTRFTITLRFNQNAYSGSGLQGLIGNGDCDDESSFLLAVQNGCLGGKIVTSTSTGFLSYSSPRGFSKGVWNQVALVYNGWSVQIWLNGSLKGTVYNISGPIRNTQVPTNIGMAYINCKARFFDGCIDDVRIYTRVLYSWSIQQLYSQGR